MYNLSMYVYIYIHTCMTSESLYRVYWWLLAMYLHCVDSWQKKTGHLPRLRRRRANIRDCSSLLPVFCIYSTPISTLMTKHQLILQSNFRWRNFSISLLGSCIREENSIHQHPNQSATVTHWLLPIHYHDPFAPSSQLQWLTCFNQSATVTTLL